MTRAELRRLGAAFLWGWCFGKGIVLATAAGRSLRATSGTVDLEPRLVVLSVDQEREMLAARVECELAAEELEERLPHAADALRRGLEAQPITLYRVREERDGGVLERTVALAG